jgi:uncharacterized membrane protein
MTEIAIKADPVVRQISGQDIADAFGKGLRDFQAAPRYGLLFGLLYALGGLLIVLSITALGMSYLSYPLAAGFSMLGPFVAVGFYEISRRLEAGESLSFSSIWSAVKSRSEVGWMAFVTLFVFLVWMYQVRLLMALFLGINANFTTLGQFFNVVLTTNEGLMFLFVGNIIGAALSIILFSLTVISFPLLLDRDVDVVTAMITSVKAVTVSPVPMIGWALVIVMVLIVSALPAFFGLVLSLPILGHTSWHLYKKVVEPA